MSVGTYPHHYYYRGHDWYRRHFPPEHERAAFTAGYGRPFLTGEASPSYLVHYWAPQQMAKLQAPPVTRKPAPNFNTGPMSASKAIDEAARQAAVNHGRFGGGDAGDLGLGQRQPTMRMGDVDITSDTMGVDFGPYLQRVLHDVKQNWYNLIPESAMPPLLKKGKLSIEFAITKTGQIAGLRYVSSSEDVALDRAAYGGITASNPFPPLPPEFGGQYLGLRFTFLYNPDPNQADLH